MGGRLHHQGRTEGHIVHPSVRGSPAEKHMHHRWLPHDPVRNPAGQPGFPQGAGRLPGQAVCGALPLPDGLL